MPMVHGNMSKPIVLVFAGPNGSGKTTLAKIFPLHGTYINADDLKEEYSLTDIEAAEKAETLRKKLVDKKADFTFETVLSTNRHIKLLQKAKENGYEIQCIYVLTCNADINVARVRSRCLAGGHDVSEDKIRSRYVKTLVLLPKLINLCDKILIFDNSVMPVLIFKKDKEKSELYPSNIWSLEKLKKLLKN